MRGCLLQLWICTTPDDVLGRLVWLTAVPGPCQECLLACSINAAGSRLCVLLRCTGAAVRPRVEESVTHAAACVQASCGLSVAVASSVFQLPLSCCPDTAELLGIHARA